jgi:molecular chaperone DnaK
MGMFLHLDEIAETGGFRSKTLQLDVFEICFRSVVENMAKTAIKPVGIDLGTTFSVIAHLDSAGRPATILNAEGDIITPSVLFFDGDSVIVGKEAVKAAIHEPEHSVAFMKREMGSSVFSRVVNGKKYPPEVLQSYVLKKLKADAELKLGHVKPAVITVPAFFDDPRRKGTQDAGEIAGLEVLNVINEPTAAAIAYGVQEGFLNARGESERTERVLVYDLGGGTFDVTLMEIDGKSYKAIATDGDVYLGGVDWDHRIVDLATEVFLKKHGGKDPRKDPNAMTRWLHEAEEVKRALSAREHTNFTCDFNDKKLRVPIDREQFEELTADLLERTRFTVSSLISEAGLQASEITRLLLVGGSTRMPMVKQMLHEEFGKAPDQSLSADEAVAHGAAIYAGLLLASHQGAAPTVTVRNVNSHTLGVLGIERETGRPVNQVIIPRNTPLPVAKVSRFQTAKAGQRSVVANVIEGGDLSGNNATRIGKCTIKDLPPDLAAGTPVDVSFEYSDAGRLKVRARLPTLGIGAVLMIERASGLTEQQVKQWGDVVGTSKGPLELNED